MAFDISTLDLDAIERREAAKHKGSTLKLVAAIGFALLWIVPFYFLAISIFKSSNEYSRNPPLALPEGIAPLWDNVTRAWELGSMGQAMMNSAFYGTVGASLAVFFAAMAAFAITRLDIPFRNGWFMLIFAGTVFPFQMYLIPLFFGYQKLGLSEFAYGNAVVLHRNLRPVPNPCACATSCPACRVKWTKPRGWMGRTNSPSFSVSFCPTRSGQ